MEQGVAAKCRCSANRLKVSLASKDGAKENGQLSMFVTRNNKIKSISYFLVFEAAWNAELRLS